MWSSRAQGHHSITDRGTPAAGRRHTLGCSGSRHHRRSGRGWRRGPAGRAGDRSELDFDKADLSARIQAEPPRVGLEARRSTGLQGDRLAGDLVGGRVTDPVRRPGAAGVADKLNRAEWCDVVEDDQEAAGPTKLANQVRRHNPLARRGPFSLGQPASRDRHSAVISNLGTLTSKENPESVVRGGHYAHWVHRKSDTECRIDRSIRPSLTHAIVTHYPKERVAIR